jgi:hypothetical protein
VVNDEDARSRVLPPEKYDKMMALVKEGRAEKGPALCNAASPSRLNGPSSGKGYVGPIALDVARSRVALFERHQRTRAA